MSRPGPGLDVDDVGDRVEHALDREGRHAGRRPALFETLVELASDQISVADASGRTVYANAAAREAYGSDAEAEGTTWVHPDDVAEVRAANARLAAQPGGSELIRCRLRRRDGSYAHVESVGVNLLDAPEVGGVLYLTRDVSERVRAEEELDRQLAGQRLVADLGVRCLRGEDYGALVRDAVAGLRHVLGVDHVHLLDVEDDGLRVRHAVGDPPVEPGLLLPAAGVADGPAGLGSAQRDPVVVDGLTAEPAVPPSPALAGLGVVSSLVVPLNGAPGPTGAIGLHTTSPRRFAPGDAAVAQAVANVLAGAASAAQREAEARHRAMHDPLTGLANRALLEDRLEQALHRSRRDGRAVTLLFVDLDRFKDVNDTHGHAAGDQVLTALAGRLQAHFRSADTVARLGGDEFVVLCSDVVGCDEAVLRGRVAAVWEEPVPLPGGSGLVRIHGTVGVASARPGESDAGGLLARADAAMYRAKRARGE